MVISIRNGAKALSAAIVLKILAVATRRCKGSEKSLKCLKKMVIKNKH